MWISNTFIHQKWMRSKQRQRKGMLQGLLSNIVPQGRPLSILSSRKVGIDRSAKTLQPSMSSLEFSTCSDSVVGKEGDAESESRESALTNACNIGTALMVINSYRTLAIMWAITGVFPFFLCLMSILRNDSSLDMTLNLQAINVMTTNSSQESCDYLFSSMVSWLAAVVSQEYGSSRYPSLLTLEMTPARCNFDESVQVTSRICELFAQKSSTYIVSDRARTTCETWAKYKEYSMAEDAETIASIAGIRVGAITMYSSAGPAEFTDYDTNETSLRNFAVNTAFDETFTVQAA